jgi:hypothetical protein
MDGTGTAYHSISLPGPFASTTFHRVGRRTLSMSATAYRRKWLPMEVVDSETSPNKDSYQEVAANLKGPIEHHLLEIGRLAIGGKLVVLAR